MRGIREIVLAVVLVDPWYFFRHEACEVHPLHLAVKLNPPHFSLSRAISSAVMEHTVP